MKLKGIENRKSKYALKAFKGKVREDKTTRDGKAYKSYGEDLDRYFRLVPSSEIIRRVILRSYPSATVDENGHILIETFMIYLYYGDRHKSFDGGMFLRKGTDIIHKCDRETIFAERVEGTDLYGQPIFHEVPRDKPCPLRDQESFGTPCPKGCKQEGNLIFTLPEIRNAGDYRPCILTTHSWDDIFGIDNALEHFSEEFGHEGAVNGSEFGHPKYGTNIPYLIYRGETPTTRPVFSKTEKITVAGKQLPKRTGKRSEDTNWAVFLSPSPDWVRARDAWKAIYHTRELGGTPSRALLQQAIGGEEYIDVEAVESPAKTFGFARVLSPSPDWKEAAIAEAMASGIKPETARALADRSESPEQFEKAVENSLAIIEAIDAGMDVNRAKALFKECGGDIARFNARVRSLLEAAR
jgi:hypothetical protein